LVVLRAFPPHAGVERHALNARVEVDAAAGTARVERHVDREQVSAARAPEDFVSAHQVGGLRPALVLQLAPGGALLRWPRRPGGLWSLLTPRPVLVLIPALPVFAITHRNLELGIWNSECVSIRNSKSRIPNYQGSE